MRLTVANVLELDLLHDAQAEVVAGNGQLQREVRWVHISEQPDVARYLKGGELLLTTGMGLGQDEDLQTRYVDELAAVGIAGLAIRLGGAWMTAPPRLVAQAASADLPLIVLHRRIGFIGLTEQIHGAIINRQYDLLTRAESIGRNFTELVMRGPDLAQILAELARIVRNPVILEDPAHQLLELAVHDRVPEDVITAWAAHSRDDPREGNGETATMGRTAHGVWADVWIRDERWGRLHVLASDRTLDEIDELAIDRAVAAVALALLAEAESHSRADRARDSLIEDILSDRYGGTAGFYGRANSCRAYFQDRNLAALALTPLGLTRLLATDGLSEDDDLRLRRRLQQEMQRAIDGTGAVALSGLDGDMVLSIVGVDASRDLRPALEEIGRAVCLRIAGKVHEVVPVVGVSGQASPKALRHAVSQAVEAAGSGRGRSQPAVIHFADLGLQHLLMRLDEGPELARFVEAELSPLLDYDAKRKTKLTDTLHACLDCGMNKTRAAEVLCIERRSLYHRLDRIRAVLQVDFEDQERMLQLRVALRGLDLLRERTFSGMTPLTDTRERAYPNPHA